MRPLLITLVILTLTTLAVVISTEGERSPVSSTGHALDGWGQ